MQRLLAPVLLLLLACTTSRVAEVEPAREHLGFVFPPSVAGFDLQDYHEYEDPNLGVVANYRLPERTRLLVSAYVYPPPRLDDGSEQPIEAHARDELAGILRYHEGGQQMSWLLELAYRSRSGRPTYQAALEIRNAELGEIYSLLLVQDLGDARLKVRVSYPPSDTTAAFAIRRFLEEFL